MVKKSCDCLEGTGIFFLWLFFQLHTKFESNNWDNFIIQAKIQYNTLQYKIIQFIVHLILFEAFTAAANLTVFCCSKIAANFTVFAAAISLLTLPTFCKC